MSESGQLLRDCLRQIAPSPSHDAVNPPRPDEVYAPRSHEAALDPARILVVGDRGAGKSFWCGCLLNDDLRSTLHGVYPKLGLDACKVELGFGGTPRSKTAPSPAVFDELQRKGFEAKDIWHGTILRCLEQAVEIEDLPRKWDDLVQAVREDVQSIEDFLGEADQHLLQEGRKVIIVFDALDRVGSDWDTIRKRTKALLQLCLSLRSFRTIKPKIFIRPDQYKDRVLTDFPDASKLTTSSVRLEWERKDLFGLLFSYLANHDLASREFQSLASGSLVELGSPAKLASPLQDNEEVQESVFMKLAGRYMGKNARKGRTYRWIHGHLADAHGSVTPRTFLEAFREAAERTPPETPTPLSYRGLQDGLRAASQVRLEQLAEDYAWIEPALGPLAEMKVPCHDSELVKRWKESNVEDTIARLDSLAPIEFQNDQDTHSALLSALIRIGVAERRPDQRINVPDIYRVAAKLVKQGAVTHRRG